MRPVQIPPRALIGSTAFTLVGGASCQAMAADVLGPPVVYGPV